MAKDDDKIYVDFNVKSVGSYSKVNDMNAPSVNNYSSKLVHNNISSSNSNNSNTSTNTSNSNNTENTNTTNSNNTTNSSNSTDTTTNNNGSNSANNNTTNNSNGSNSANNTTNNNGSNSANNNSSINNANNNNNNNSNFTNTSNSNDNNINNNNINNSIGNNNGNYNQSSLVGSDKPSSGHQFNNSINNLGGNSLQKDVNPKPVVNPEINKNGNTYRPGNQMVNNLNKKSNNKGNERLQKAIDIGKRIPIASVKAASEAVDKGKNVLDKTKAVGKSEEKPNKTESSGGMGTLSFGSVNVNPKVLIIAIISLFSLIFVFVIILVVAGVGIIKPAMIDASKDSINVDNKNVDNFDENSINSQAYIDVYNSDYIFYYDEVVDVSLVASKSEFDIDYMNDLFGSKNVCENSDEGKCSKVYSKKFFTKLYDLYYLYLSKYNVKLDIPLLMSTLLFKTDSFDYYSYLSDYDRALIVESDWNPSTVTALDWDYDYENQINYLVTNDNSLDMQVLAKKMVTKITTQSCMKSDVKSKTKKVKDYEEDLTCEADETLVIGESTYELDLERYEEFLLEYIEKKYYSNRTVLFPSVSLGPDYETDKVPSVTSRRRKKGSNSSGSSINQVPVSATGKEAIDRMITIGRGEVGNNGIGYRSWYNNGVDWQVDWCAIFVSWLFNEIGGLNKYIVKQSGAGSIPRCSTKEGSTIGVKTGDCAEVVDLGVWYESEYTDPNTVPRPGDVIVFTWNGVGHYEGHDKYFSDHVGFVYAVDDNNVYTIEGNTGTDNNNTSFVQLKQWDRKSGNINGYFRPYY